MSFSQVMRSAVFLASLYLFVGATSSAFGGQCTIISIAVQTATGGATVSGGNGVFSVSFGTLNGLGVGTPGAGISVRTTGSGATYTTPVNINIFYFGCSGGLSLTVKVYQDATASAASQSAAREGGAAISVVPVPTSPALATIIATPANSGNASFTLTRYVGLFVSSANGASRVSGSLAPKLVYVFSAQ